MTMLVVAMVGALLIGAVANNPTDEAQYMNLNVKSVKGGYGYRGGDNVNRFFNNTQHGYVEAHQNLEVGVCYIEVPTSSLARDPKHIPRGNGSRSDLTRIRSCCAGYIRNIHNYLICDPVCSNECVNSLCTAPNTCTCFPDHVKNAAGFCVATCPIGCQNGHCDGGRCLCKEGFKLDVSRKFCVPHCRENCGGIGNCTAPNTCQCNRGYSSTPDGSCRPGTQHPAYGPGGYPGANPTPGPCGPCINGHCVGTECRCQQGYLIYKGECKALCNPNCGPHTECVAPNVCAPSVNKVNGTQQNNNPQYPYSSQHTSYQNPGQGNSAWAQQGHNPYPNGPDSQHNTNQQNPHSPRPLGYQTNLTNAPYPGQQNQYPGQQNQYPGQQNQYPGQQNQYPGQQNQYPGQQNQYPGQQNQHPGQQNQWAQTNHGPNGTNYPTQGPYPAPAQNHLYPNLPNNYPYPQGNPNGTGPIMHGPDGQVYYQNRPYNPLADVTFNLQQGRTERPVGQGQNGTQGQYGGGQNSQGQYSHGQSNQGQYGQGQYNQGQYGQGQFGQGQFSQGQYNQGQYSQGQYGQGQYNQSQYGQGQYGQGQYGQGQYGQGQYSQGQNYQGQHNGHNFADGGQISSNVFGNCEQPCVNGNCIGHNTCECLPGYNLDSSDSTLTRCIPYCHGGCINGHCVSPNTCACAEGYHKDFSVKGRSACIKRDRRSADTPAKIADLLVFEIPDYE